MTHRALASSSSHFLPYTAARLSHSPFSCCARSTTPPLLFTFKSYRSAAYGLPKNFHRPARSHVAGPQPPVWERNRASERKKEGRKRGEVGEKRVPSQQRRRRHLACYRPNIAAITRYYLYWRASSASDPSFLTFRADSSFLLLLPRRFLLSKLASSPPLLYILLLSWIIARRGFEEAFNGCARSSELTNLYLHN